MKALSLTQPWATLVAIRAKTIETRSWPTTYRGPIAIHAAKGFPPEARLLCSRWPFGRVLVEHGVTSPGALPRGAIIAVGRLSLCHRFDHRTASEIPRTEHYPPHEVAFGDFTAGRFGFWLEDVIALPTPIPCRGMLGLWTVPGDVEKAILDQMPSEVSS